MSPSASSAPPWALQWASLGAVLLGTLVLLHGGLVWGSQVLCGGDIVNHAHPLTLFWVSGPWLQGWCPASFSGRPFFADIQSALLYPPRWAFRSGIPVEIVTTQLSLLHSLFGAVGMYVLLRVRLGHLPGMLGAVLWLAGGYTILRYTNGVVTLIYALSWVPWVWWAVEQCGPRRPAMTGVLALCAAMMFLAGSPQVVLITALGMLVWAVGRLVQEGAGWRDHLVLAGHFAAAAVVALVIIFPQLVASAQYTAAAVGRGGTAQWDHLVSDSLGPWLLITNLAPEFFDAGNAEGIYWGSQTGFMETNAYIGIAPLMLAAFGMVGIIAGWRGWSAADRRWFVCIAILFLVGMIVAFGRFTPIYRVLYDFIPGFNLFRVPARWLLWPFACAIILAAWGLHFFLQPRTGTRSPFSHLAVWGAVSGIMMGGLLLLLVFVEPVMRLCGFNPAVTPPEFARVFTATARGALGWALGLAAMASVVGFLAVMGRLPARPAVILLVAMTIMDLMRFWQPFRQPLPHEHFTRHELPTETVYHKISTAAFNDWYYPRTELIEFMDSEPRGRYLSTDWLYSYLVDQYTREIYTERGMVHGLESMRGYQPLQLKSYARDFARIAATSLDNPAAVGSFLHAPEVIDRAPLDAYNAVRVLTYEASLGDAAARGRLESLGLELEAAFAFRPDVRLEAWRNPHAPGWAWLSTEGDWPALDSRLEGNHVTLTGREPAMTSHTVTIPAGGAWFHISEVDYPGWGIHIVAVHSDEAPLFEAGRSVFISDAGTYEVTHRFSLPRLTRLTLPLSGLTLILLLAFIGWRSLRDDKPMATTTTNPES